MMKLLILAILLTGFTTLTGMQFSKAQFVDNASSSNNTFSAASEFGNTPTPTQTPLTSVVINEIMWMGSSGSIADEWVELRNLTNAPITLTNWIIERLGSSPQDIVFSGTIPANGFFLIANYNPADSNTILNVQADIVSSNVDLLNVGELLILRDNSGAFIDAANTPSGWLKGINGTSPAPDRSMERKSPVADGSQASSWHNSNGQTNLDSGVVDFATPKATNSAGL